ncbi:GntR family transcriptional regulator [Williamsia sp. 1135]|uniref:GntR family transcriptional regulator n=1 Tax=Williamsia sp. 1135 TaxID=1889262 RepID=UPI000A0FD1A4|nr:GntR family transcriptional regulator [Williamsia sp. 1135]ORM34074.1 hypothetical protein BFL43_12540 [Williamsia sp. 1135]
MTQLSHLAPTRHPRSVGGSAGTRQRSARVVHQLLRSSIKSGVLNAGESLSEESLIENLDSTRAAVRSALQMLADEGLVSRQRRMGTVVRGRPLQLPVEDIIGNPSSGPLEYRMIGDHAIPAHHLIRSRMPTDSDSLRMIDYVISNGGVPIGTLVAFQINPNAHPPVHNPDVDGIAQTFETVYSRPFGRMETCIDAVGADERTARILNIAPGAVLLVRDQVLSDVDGNVHEYAYAHYRADMVSFRSPAR